MAAVMKREDPRDAFVSVKYKSLADLPQGAKVGTSSLRRQAQIKATRPDLVIESLRGNVDTRLRKMVEGHYDAIILAASGLRRLGLTEHVKEYISPDVMTPAAGQGALGIEIRLGDKETLKHIEFLNDAPTRTAVTAERALLNALGGGCQVPIGAFAEVDGATVRVRGVCARPDGTTVLREKAEGTDAKALGEQVGATLIRKGANEILEEIYGYEVEVPKQP